MTNSKNKSQDFEVYKEQYKLKQEDIISFLQGKSFNFMLPGKFHIEVIPPNHGLHISYQNWDLIKSYLMQINLPFENISTFINMIEDKGITR